MISPKLNQTWIGIIRDPQTSTVLYSPACGGMPTFFPTKGPKVWDSRNYPPWVNTRCQCLQFQTLLTLEKETDSWRWDGSKQVCRVVWCPTRQESARRWQGFSSITNETRQRYSLNSAPWAWFDEIRYQKGKDRHSVGICLLILVFRLTSMSHKGTIMKISIRGSFTHLKSHTARELWVMTFIAAMFKPPSTIRYQIRQKRKN